MTTLAPANYEFSWKNRRINGHRLLPPVRDQGRTGTCIFQAVSAAAEVELMMENARTKPNESCTIKISTNAFIADYERVEEYQPNDDWYKVDRALKLFKEEGVLCTSRGNTVTREKKKIKGFRKRKNVRFEDIKKLIKKGRAVVGSIRMDETFGDEKPGEIYDYDCSIRLMENGSPIAHAVVFVGHGVCDGRPYLLFMNSHGEDYCEGGFGRVYFEHVFDFYTIDV